MRGKDLRTHTWFKPIILSLAGVLAAAGGALQGAATGRGARGTASAPARAPATATSTAPATTKQAPAMAAEVLLKPFPGNANLIAARSDARNFTLEGRVRDVRSVMVDTATGIATQPAAPPATSGFTVIGPGSRNEVRVVLVGRGQSDDVAAHFTCHMDSATEDAALKLKPDQLVRLTGSIGSVVAAADRIDINNCHDLVVTTPLNVGDQLVGNWRDAQVMVDGTALKKYNLAHNLKADDIPDGSYVGNWRLDLALKADNTFAEELDDNKGQMLKKVAGRYTVTKDGADEATLRLDVQGGPPQEATVSVQNGILKFTPPSMSDKFLMPNQHFTKLDGTVLNIDTKSLKDQTMRWFTANINPNAPPNIRPAVSAHMDNSFSSHQGYIFEAGSATVRSGRTTLLVCVFGKLMVLEFSPAETQARAVNSKNIVSGPEPAWGLLMAPEIKVDPPLIQNRTLFDPAKPLVGKVTIRSLRRPTDAPYNLVLFSAGGFQMMPLEKPGPDPQTVDIHIDRLPNAPAAENPRFLVLLVVRQPAPDDPLGDPNPRIISEPIPLLLDLAPVK